MAKQKKPQRREWQPMERGQINPDAEARYVHEWGDNIRCEAWGNDVYQCVVVHFPNGGAYLSLKRHDRHVVRDWRHLQSIKNEVVGPEREAVELFPAESRLIDSANQTHLWALPEGARWPLGFDRGREVADGRETREWNRGDGASFGGRARQRDWQPGLRTGPGCEVAS